MKITIKIETDLRKWEADLKSFPDASLFFAPPWLESFKSPRRKPVYFRFLSSQEYKETLQQDNTIGLASGLHIEPAYHPVLKKLYSPLYLFSAPAVIQSDQRLVKACIAALTDFAVTHKNTHLLVKSWDYSQKMDFEGLSLIPNFREEYIIDLTGEWQDVRQKMRKSIREQTRKAIRSGLTFHESDSPEIIDNLIFLLEATQTARASKGYKEYSYYYMPYLDKSLLCQLVRNKIARLFYVQKADTIPCVLLTIVYDKKAYALLIGTNEAAYKLRAPAFLWYHTIERLNTEGVKYLNMGGVPKDSSGSKLIFAKKALGAEKYLCSGGITPHLNGRFFNLLTDIYAKTSESRLMRLLSGWLLK